MKTIGLIGGMSWESTVTYYRLINESVNEKLGGLHSAKILLYSVDFAEIAASQAKGDWAQGASILSGAAVNLEKAGADFILICTNTMHKVAPEVQKHIGIPLIHLADATADALISAGIDKVALLGTIYTMTENFYKERLIARGISVLIPGETDAALVNRVIYDELCRGVISAESRAQYQRIIEQLQAAGARGVILGCTEIGMLIKQTDSVLPVFDTTQIHAHRAAMEAIADR
ncbi:MAG: aspartate/glutamate racemase family protein [Firmicutes bacterium]|nr:aspartate/glutamate racemase family protein [Bacillota bacterium]